jgi:hypothetical protein
VTNIIIPEYPRTRALLTNGAYGYPTSKSPRRFAPIALACLHITANPNEPPATAMQERNNVQNNQPGGPSAHIYRNRDGSTGYAIDHTKYAAWSNGDVRSPKVDKPYAKRVIDWMTNLKANCNEAFWLAVENCGNYPNGYPLTAAQLDSNALDIARESIRTNLPISRYTVMAHSDFNTETRPHCPAPSDKVEGILAQIIDQAKVYREIIHYQDTTEALQLQLDQANASLDTTKEALQQSEELRAAQAVTLESWNVYADEVTSRAGGILALDRP